MSPSGDMVRPGAEVVIVSYSNPRDVVGGAERIAWAEAELLGATRSVAFVSASASIQDVPFPQHRIAGWTRRLYQPTSTNRNPLSLGIFHLLSLFNPVAFIEALSLFWRIRPKVVHTHNLVAISPAVWLAARLAGARVVHTHHDLWLLCEYATMTDAEGLPCEEALPVCRVCKAFRGSKMAQLRLVSGEVFPSRWLRERLARSGSVVPNFATTFRAEVGDPQPARPSTIAYVGALTPHKLGVLLEAFELLPAESLPLIRLVIAGDGPLALRVKRAADTNPRIEYRGPLDSSARDMLLDEVALLVIPSTCPEVSPLVFFEGLAAGVPAIASDIGGISELEGYGNLVLVPPGDAMALADALRSLFGDGDRLGALRANALRNSSEAAPTRFVAQIESVIDQVVEGGDGPKKSPTGT